MQNEEAPAEKGGANKFWVSGFTTPVVGKVERISVTQDDYPTVILNIRESNGNLAVFDLAQVMGYGEAA